MSQIPWRIELLGAFKAIHDGREITRFYTRKAGLLLATLAYYRDRVRSRAELYEILWPEEESEVVRVRFRVTLNGLRRQLEPAETVGDRLLIVNRGDLMLNSAIYCTDVTEFEAATRAGADATDEERQNTYLLEAVRLYSDHLLPGFDADWIVAERQRLSDAYLQAVRRLIPLLFRQRNFDLALDYAQRAVRIDPFREEAHRTLIRLYAAIRSPAAALRQYQELTQLLAEELQTTPSETTRRLVAELFGGAIPETRAPVQMAPVSMRSSTSSTSSSATEAPLQPPKRTDQTVRSAVRSLPKQYTAFFGREEEIEQLRLLLIGLSGMAEGGRSSSQPAAGLITLTGLGGSGKTRLALEVAGQIEATFTGGIVFVALADVPEAGRIPDAILEALGQVSSGDRSSLAQVIQALQQTPCLLVLDNFEHLMDEGVPVLDKLRAEVTHLTLLVTSRQRLELASEHEILLQPLPTPLRPGTPERLMEFPSVQLFVDRAQQAQPGFRLTPRNAAAIARVCAGLEGIPLAIELAAAWAQTLTPAQMASRLSHRFDLLVGDRRQAPPRHQTLRAALGWSFRLLPAELQGFLVRLSIFRGGWSMDAAAVVCEEPRTQEFLRQLLRHSLVVNTEQGEEMRYRQLETVREFCQEQIARDVASALAARHADYYLRWVEETKLSNGPPDTKENLDRLEAEYENIVTGLRWYGSQADGAEQEMRLAAGIGDYWIIRGRKSEGRELLRHALLRDCESLLARTRVLDLAGHLALEQQDLSEAHRHFGTLLALARQAEDRHLLVRALHLYSALARSLGDDAKAGAYDTECLAVARQIGDDSHTCVVLLNIGETARNHHNYEMAHGFVIEGLEIARRQGNIRFVGACLCTLGMITAAQSGYVASQSWFEESLTLLRALSDNQFVARTLHEQAEAMFHSGWNEEARHLLQESLVMNGELGNQHSICRNLDGLARIASRQGAYVYGARLLGAAENILTTTGLKLMNLDYYFHEAALTEIRSGLSDPTFYTALQAGKVMTLPELISYALQGSETTRQN